MPTKFIKADCSTMFAQDLDVVAKFVLVSLNYWDRGNGRGCFASKSTLCKMLNIGEHQLRRALHTLQEQGYIVINRRGQGKTDVIKVVRETEDAETRKSEASNTLYEIKKEEVDIVSTSEDVCEEKETDGVKSDTEACKNEPLNADHREKLQAAVGDEKYNLHLHDAILVKEHSEGVMFRVASVISADFIRNVYGNQLDNAFGKRVYFTWS